jgi:hypothetical protein
LGVGAGVGVPVGGGGGLGLGVGFGVSVGDGPLVGVWMELFAGTSVEPFVEAGVADGLAEEDAD